MGDIRACQAKSKPPEHITIDWSYLLTHWNSKTHKLPSIFDESEWKLFNLYDIRIGYIYNPSKFWIVREQVELDYFHRYISKFYSIYKEHYQLQNCYLKLNMYCVSFTENAYYRSVLLSVPHASRYAIVFLLDFGYLAKVDLNHIYFMTKKMYGVSQFAVRAGLAGIGPKTSTMWTQDAIKKFSQLVNNQLLKAQVRGTDPVTKTVFLHLGLRNLENIFVDDLTDRLVREGVIRKLTSMELKEIKYQTKKKRRSKRGCTHGIAFLFWLHRRSEEPACASTILLAKICLSDIGNAKMDLKSIPNEDVPELDLRDNSYLSQLRQMYWCDILSYGERR